MPCVILLSSSLKLRSDTCNKNISSVISLRVAGVSRDVFRGLKAFCAFWPRESCYKSKKKLKEGRGGSWPVPAFAQPKAFVYMVKCILEVIVLV